ncbi:Oligopeptide-binding protein AppA precursor [Polystyrenella longa]|uniref:Oligopeptide-binding protein AppA n=1 Tax=Polystyrenella longa TaxID=2528007 RepID=A0A518CS03_9PLAN|nr:peptide-binding protein [Polystyrenella longa]QDU81993.1 Oligopeptide-binding protein AppA precursor [Polystyrenella longa]
MDTSRNSFLALAALLALIAVFPGCSDSEKADSSKDEVKSLVEPFDPPTLEELDAKAEWEEMPVLDSMKLMQERQAKEEPLATYDEAISLKNNSDEDNAKILSAMGRGPKEESEIDYDAVINRHVSSDMKSTNPLLGSSAIEFEVVGQTSFGLFSFDWDFNPFAVEATVKSWHSSKDRLYDKVVIRDDLVWSDGTPITAHDVAFSFRTIMNPSVPASAVRSGTDQLRWVEAYDDHTVVFFHKESLASNVWNVNYPVIPKHVYESLIDKDPSLQEDPQFVALENEPIVGGPYKMTSRTRDREVVLSRREEWYMKDGKQVRPKPRFKEIRFQIIREPDTALLSLKKGDIDEMGLNSEQWSNQTSGDDFYEKNTKVTGPEWTYFYFGWNTENPLFKDKRVRQAMSWAYNYDELINNFLHGLNRQSVGIFHPDSWMFPKEEITPYEQNFEKAVALLKEAGWEDHDGDGILDKEIGGKQVPFEFTLLCTNQPRSVKMCTLMKANLEQIGIRCSVRPQEFTVLMDKTLNHKFQAYLGGWGTGADPSTAKNIWTTNAIKNGRNYVSYENPKIDELFYQAEREFDRDKQAELYSQIHQILWEDQPYTWLFYMNGFHGFNKDVRGYVWSPRGPFGYGPGFDHLWKAVD